MIEPMMDRVLLAPEEQVDGLIVVPDAHRKLTGVGVVQAVGEGVVSASGVVMPLQVKVGDRACFRVGMGTWIEVEGKKMLLLYEKDILGILD